MKICFGRSKPSRKIMIAPYGSLTCRCDCNFKLSLCLDTCSFAILTDQRFFITSTVARFDSCLLFLFRQVVAPNIMTTTVHSATCVSGFREYTPHSSLTLPSSFIRLSGPLMLVLVYYRRTFRIPLISLLCVPYKTHPVELSAKFSFTALLFPTTNRLV